MQKNTSTLKGRVQKLSLSTIKALQSTTYILWRKVSFFSPVHLLLLLQFLHFPPQTRSLKTHKDMSNDCPAIDSPLSFPSLLWCGLWIEPKGSSPNRCSTTELHLSIIFVFFFFWERHHLCVLCVPTLTMCLLVTRGQNRGCSVYWSCIYRWL